MKKNFNPEPLWSRDVWDRMETLSLSPTHSIQALKSSTLCCSRESNLMMYIPESIESIWLSYMWAWGLGVGLEAWGLGVGLEAWRLGGLGAWGLGDGLDVIKVLSREQHNVLLFMAWIQRVAEIFHFLFHSGFHVSAALGNGISWQYRRFNSWKVVHRVALAKVL